MSILLPFSQNSINDTADIIAMASNDFSPHIAFLSRTSIIIRDILSPNIPVVESFTRSPESMQKYGQNSWLRWFNSNIVFFGTSSGTVFMSHVGSINEEPKTLCISRVILSSFLCHNNLAVTTTSSQIYFINSDCSLNFQVTLFDEPKGIRHCSFHPPSTLSCLVDGIPYFISIDSSSFERKYAPLPKALPICGVEYAALSMNRALLAVAKSTSLTERGEILLVNVSPKKYAPIIVHRNKVVQDEVRNNDSHFNDTKNKLSGVDLEAKNEIHNLNDNGDQNIDNQNKQNSQNQINQINEHINSEFINKNRNGDSERSLAGSQSSTNNKVKPVRFIGDAVVSMFWTMNENSLVSIKESGKVIVWCYAGFASYECTLPPEVRGAVSFEFEPRTHRLYWSDMRCVRYVSFATILSHYAVTSNQIFDLRTNEFVFDGCHNTNCESKTESNNDNSKNSSYKTDNITNNVSRNENSISCNLNNNNYINPNINNDIGNGLFPIAFFASTDSTPSNHFAFSSFEKVSVDGKAIINMKAVDLAFINNKLVVFNIRDAERKIFMNFFEINEEKAFKEKVSNDNLSENTNCNYLTLLGEVEFPFFPRQISVFQNEMSVTGRDKYAVVKLLSHVESYQAMPNPEEEEEENDVNGKSLMKNHEISSQFDVKLEHFINSNNNNNNDNNTNIRNDDKDNIYVSVSVFDNIGAPIEASFVVDAGKVAVFFATNEVFVCPRGPLICQNVDYAWSFNDGLPYVFLHTGNTTIVSLFKEKVRIDCAPVYTDGYRVFCLHKKQKFFGKINLFSRAIGHFFFAHLVDKSSSVSYFKVMNDFFKKNFLREEYASILGNTIVKAFPIEKEEILIGKVENEISSLDNDDHSDKAYLMNRKMLAAAIAIALSKMTIEMKMIIFKKEKIEWSLIIPVLKDRLQYNCIVSIPFASFVKVFGEKDSLIFKKLRNIESIMKTLIGEGEFIRGFIISIGDGSSNVVNFCKVLDENTKVMEIDFEELIVQMEREKKNNQQEKPKITSETETLFDASNKNDIDNLLFMKYCRFFGSACLQGGKGARKLALAAFVVLEDSIKVAGALMLNDDLRDEAKDFVERKSDSKYAPLLKEALNDI